MVGVVVGIVWGTRRILVWLPILLRRVHLCIVIPPREVWVVPPARVVCVLEDLASSSRWVPLSVVVGAHHVNLLIDVFLQVHRFTAVVISTLPGSNPR